MYYDILGVELSLQQMIFTNLISHLVEFPNMLVHNSKKKL